MAKIASFGAYIPLFRLSRQEMSDAWGVPAVPGERSVANADEDSLTMAVAAGTDCLAGVDPATIDGLFFATTTSPYDEKQCAGVIAAALDMRSDINTADFTGSLRAASTALRAAADAVDSGSADSILVVAADCRLGEPESMWEQLLGDGAGAILISKEGSATLRGFKSTAGEQLGVWRRSEDRYVRSFESKVEMKYGYLKSAVEAGQALLDNESLAPGDLAKAVITAGDPGSQGKVARSLGLAGAQVEDMLFMSVGNVGVPQMLMMLAGALPQAKAGDKLLVVNNGDGADAFLVEIDEEFSPVAGRKGLAGHLLQKRNLPNYTSYARFRRLMKVDDIDPRGSAVTYWRDINVVLNFHAGRCSSCGAVLYPIPRVCGECGTKDKIDEIKLAKTGTVFTFTLDHLEDGKYVNVPVPRLVLDLEGGGRVFLSMTDGDPEAVKIGMSAEVVFRRMHDASSFHNYYWKCRPVPRASS
ncbi:MAG: OB-fold domain-containing protein [Deltaproteobacteria bacterium]|nr:OB-fold domain-containing protein [Deltaproteobacteria bacterium]MBW2401353.1 OB-fold domain-containing protein [Deltaproteobacteria bacterium]